MGQAQLNLVHDSQGEPRGDDKTFVSGMIMGAARRDFADGSTLNLRAMLSPDPFMGKDGFPLLLAAGETADGVNPLIDRQHPHELVMELSAGSARRPAALAPPPSPSAAGNSATPRQPPPPGRHSSPLPSTPHS